MTYLDDKQMTQLTEAIQDLRMAMSRQRIGHEELLSVGDICRRWKIEPETFHRLHKKRLPQCRLMSHSLRFRLSDIEAYESARMETAPDMPAPKRPMRRRSVVHASS